MNFEGFNRSISIKKIVILILIALAIYGGYALKNTIANYLVDNFVVMSTGIDFK